MGETRRDREVEGPCRNGGWRMQEGAGVEPRRGLVGIQDGGLIRSEVV